MRAELLQEISHILRASSAYLPAGAATASDIFEAYVWALGIEAARREGARVEYLDRLGRTTRNLEFRTSPGAIYSTIAAYSHAEIRLQRCPPLEAHVGILVEGRSGVVHECDVAILEKAEAITSRRRQVHPRHSKVVLAVECKFYSTNLGIDLARSFLGLTEEIHQGNRYFVANTTSENVERMLTQHDRAWETLVIPGNKKNQNRLRALFETTFKRYKALNS